MSANARGAIVNDVDLSALALRAAAAAEAVVGLACGLHLDHLGAGYDRARRPCVHVAWRAGRPTAASQRARILAAIAGSHASAQVYAAHGRPLRELDAGTARRVKQMRDVLSAMQQRPAPALADLAAEAAEHVTALWPQVRRVDTALRTCVHLSGEEVAALRASCAREPSG